MSAKNHKIQPEYYCYLKSHNSPLVISYSKLKILRPPTMITGIFGACSTSEMGGGPGAVVNAACLESWRSWVQTPLWPSNFKETKSFFPAQL